MLERAYRDCRRIAAAHGRTYFLATRLLEPERRPAVHALYAFARLVDDIVDASDAPSRAAESAARLDEIEHELRARLVDAPIDATDGPEERALLAVSDTIRRYSIAAEHFWVFLDSMRMDIPGGPHYRDRYATMADLRDYMRGSAAAIGLQLLPVLGTVVPVTDAEPAAAALGEAFQLTNFLRDIGEDLDRGRLYLPGDDLAAFGVDAELLFHCRESGHTDPRVRRALAHLIAVNRSVYRRAVPGIDLLTPRVRPAIRTAATLYGGILDEIERADYAVFTRRAVVPRHRRVRVAARECLSASPRLLPVLGEPLQ
ncbi:phytoene/squalene synthase family protein [Nocardia aurantiaca]|uniref:Phytoene/squalene synthase family protein n=1 Tax=Nocardia aurantiaca TaxID=2675850 RepID=A0A6I3L018_9NOCA|nr:phytoene/squalene synthase family protein [Nocardia aurantiaca]MTE14026.1 phytoene/squalene synthase family protein [Nocardia aurantiaca]